MKADNLPTNFLSKTTELVDISNLGDVKIKSIKLNANDIVTVCPICGNNRQFIVHSNQVAIDSCNVWVECECGYDPTSEGGGHRFEDVWGGINNHTTLSALYCWNDAIQGDNINV